MENSLFRSAFASACAGLLACLPLLHPAAAAAQDIDLQEIFRCVDHAEVDEADCDHARSLILNNCTACHTFVPIVLQQFDAGGWRGLLDRHRDRVEHLPDADVEAVHQYLTANFNEEFEPPELPPELLATWTAY
jgi:mono/diheme cytochrome c family protein